MGESNPEVPQTLTYKLVSKLCFVTEINIQPFQVLMKNIYIFLHSVFSMMIVLYGHTLQKSFQWFSSSYQNLFLPLVYFCRLNCWDGWCLQLMAYSTFDSGSSAICGLTVAGDISLHWDTSSSYQVIANGVSKSLSLRCCPETSCAIKAIEDDDIIEPLEVETNGSVEMEKLKKNHRVYAFLARRLHYYVTRDCISEAICASSTNNYLKENIHNTLVLNGGTSYWSSRGEISPDVPETLTYKLVPELRFITKIRIHLIQGNQNERLILQVTMSHILHPFEDHLVWTYTSEKFPLVHKNCLGTFSLPEPVPGSLPLVDICKLDFWVGFLASYVIASEFSKILCLRLFPETSSVIAAIEENNIIEPSEVESTGSVEVEKLKKNHQIYALLARGLAPSLTKDCIFEAISASSTDHYPEEMIHLTLEPTDRVYGRPSYWSSLGESNPEVPETLTYKLVSKLCFITEINIQPFQVFYDDFPICSAKAVRFRVGHVRDLQRERYLIGDYRAGRRSIEDQAVWTYTSEKFPMIQENCLQNFKLPEPVLAVGGLLQIELLGRVALAVDDLFYFCITHVQVVGRPLGDDFVAELIDQSRKCVLKVLEHLKCCSIDISKSSSTYFLWKSHSGFGPKLLTEMDDFLPLLNRDLSLKIFSCLDEPADVVRASAVSHSLRAFVIANGVSKSLCLRWCPETSCAIEAIAGTI
ncbi:hypothetical protein C5167_006350 [Papaver somniferum]|uniref:F-box domain-containing protein n=1 Tax=Papaver somniferum TaxID=3469 RepID=A0A4Y7JGH7_PAPSO|nr:hypothetical protein C5167_006350 [Papaver somniferum]